MPDRDAAPRRRRRTSSSPHPALHAVLHPTQQPDWTYDAVVRPRRPVAHRMGIPRILGRRARWVGARLRREA